MSPMMVGVSPDDLTMVVVGPGGRTVVSAGADFGVYA
jgi:hypothetical protein